MSSDVTHLQIPLPQTIEKHCQDGQGLESSRYKVELLLYGPELRGYEELNRVPQPMGTCPSPPLS